MSTLQNVDALRAQLAHQKRELKEKEERSWKYNMDILDNIYEDKKLGADTRIGELKRVELEKIELGQQRRFFWKDDGVWYNGVVIKRRDCDGRFFVRYDDGDENWEDLERMKSEPLTPSLWPGNSSGRKDSEILHYKKSYEQDAALCYLFHHLSDELWRIECKIQKNFNKLDERLCRIEQHEKFNLSKSK